MYEGAKVRNGPLPSARALACVDALACGRALACGVGAGECCDWKSS